MSEFEKRGNFVQNAKFWHFQAITISKQWGPQTAFLACLKL